MRTPFPHKRQAAVVKGPIRCHKCQLSCEDAAAYLNHVCETVSRDDEAQLRRLVFAGVTRQ